MLHHFRFVGTYIGGIFSFLTALGFVGAAVKHWGEIKEFAGVIKGLVSFTDTALKLPSGLRSAMPLSLRAKIRRRPGAQLFEEDELLKASSTVTA